MPQTFEVPSHKQEEKKLKTWYSQCPVDYVSNDEQYHTNLMETKSYLFDFFVFKHKPVMTQHVDLQQCLCEV